MKNHYFFLLPMMLFLFSNLHAQNKVSVISSDNTETILRIELSDYQLKKANTPNGVQFIPIVDIAARMLEEGSPDLPKITASIIIDDLAATKLEILDSKYTIVDRNIEIAPSKGNFTRDIDPASVAYTYNDVYTTDQFFPSDIADLGTPYIARDYRGQAVQIYPFQYNPVKKELRVYTEITVKVSALQEQGENPFSRNPNKNQPTDKEFKQVYSKHFINYHNYEKYTPVEEEGNMLIICYDAWVPEVQPLADWKNKIGRPTEIVTVTEAGSNAAAIKTFVTDYYNTNGLTYLLLIGDAAQVPTNSGAGLGGDSDNAYAYITGSDHYLEFFVGRFSAENAAEVTTQVERTIEYERGDALTPGWLNKTMGVTSSQGAGIGDDGESDFDHYRNMAADLLDFTYAESAELFDGSQGGNDASGDPTPAMVAAEINDGIGIINYTGHGSEYTWVSSGFSVTDVNNLTNDNMLPFIWSVACVNGDFVSRTCFGESWLRATHNGEPTGAVGIMASTINQSWAPPMAAQDEMVDILAQSYQNNIKRTFGGLSINGCFLMNDEYSDYDMTDTWTCFGDPSLLVRTDDPTAMNISHDAVVLLGTSDFNVNCDTEDALVCLSKAGVIVGTANVSGGSAQVPLAGITPGDVLDVTVTGFNKIVYEAQLTVVAPSGPYVIVDSYQLETDHTINFGETQPIGITLSNVGPNDALGVTATLSCSDPYVLQMTDYENIAFGDIAGNNGTSSISGNFSITVDNNLPDQYAIPFTLSITDGNDTWESNFNVIVNSPVLQIGTLTVDDNAYGNGDGVLDPNETADLKLIIENAGHADVDNLIGSAALVSGDYLTFNNATTSPQILAVGNNYEAVFNVTATDVAEGTAADIYFEATAGSDEQFSTNNTKQIIIGFVPEYCAASVTYEDEYISNVSFADIDNATGWSTAGYGDHTDVITDVEQGETYLLTTTVGSPYSSDQLTCWVDWNYDGDFDDAGETYALNWNSPTATGNISVPTGLIPRMVRMRVRLAWNTSPVACGSSSYGETEDYTLNVLEEASVGVRENPAFPISIYPNPNNGFFTLDMSTHQGTKQVCISDISGKTVYLAQTKHSTITVDNQLSKGLYLVKVSAENAISVQKLIVK